jgi:3-hydroxybutyryl-CoA dehydrogenase
MSSPALAGKEIRNALVIGTGTMGRGIAQVAAQRGFQVTLCDVDLVTAEGALSRIAGSLERAVSRGKVTEAERDAALGRLSAAGNLTEAAASADLVVEAVPEKLDLKREILARAAGSAPARALLASNTSSLSIAMIAEGVPGPERVLGMHFFNPVPAMALCEIVRHAGSAPEAVAAAREVAARLGKISIVVADAPGFASSRLGIAVGMEAIRMVEEEVASPADIDTAMKLGYGHPMGPLELTDLVGLDVRLAIADSLAARLGERFRPPALLRSMVDQGALGAKSGAGFYRWVDGKRVDD